jgi:hypothetical protein
MEHRRRSQHIHKPYSPSVQTLHYVPGPFSFTQSPGIAHGHVQGRTPGIQQKYEQSMQYIQKNHPDHLHVASDSQDPLATLSSAKPVAKKGVQIASGLSVQQSPQARVQHEQYLCKHQDKLGKCSNL